MKIVNATLAATIAVMTAGCAQSPNQVGAAYVSPQTYSTLSCRELNAEAIALNNALASATGAQQQAANNDAAVTAAALVLFWPAAFFVGRNDNSAQLAQLRGQAEAISAAARAKGC